MNLKIPLVLLLLFSSTCYASLITVESGNKFSIDNGSIVDHQTGLEWLSLTETVNRSFNQVLNDINTDEGQFKVADGWRYASLSEVGDFYNNWFSFQEDSLSIFTDQDDDLQILFSSFGTMGPGLFGNNSNLFGATSNEEWGGDHPEATVYSVGVYILDVRLEEFLQPEVIAVLGTHNIIKGDYAANFFGHYLVRETSLSLSEPSPLLLFLGVGLIFMLVRYCTYTKSYDPKDSKIRSGRLPI